MRWPHYIALAFLRRHKQDTDGESDMPFQVEVMSVGTWNGIKFTLEDLKDMAKNFTLLRDVIKPPVKKLNLEKPPIKLGHTKDWEQNDVGAPAYGWVESLKVKGNKLVANIYNMPGMLKRAIEQKAYRRVSSEVLFNYQYDGKRYGRVFSALAFLGAEAPAVKNLEDLQAYFKDYIRQNSEPADGSGSFESIVVFESGIEDEDDDHKAVLIINKSEDEAMTKELEAQVAKLADEKTKLAEENAKLAREAEDREKAAFEATKTASRDSLNSFCDEQVKAEKMSPAMRDAIVNPDQMDFTEAGDAVITIDQFKAFVAAGEKLRDDKEKAKSGKGDGKKFSDVQEELEFAVKEYQAKNKDVDYVTATAAVLSENDDLAGRYTADYADTKGK